MKKHLKNHKTSEGGGYQDISKVLKASVFYKNRELWEFWYKAFVGDSDTVLETTFECFVPGVNFSTKQIRNFI